jgi:hypothetical protein
MEIREIAGLKVDANNMVVDGRKPVSERHYYGSRLPEGMKCFEDGRYINTELLSPVVYDHEQKIPKFNTSWYEKVGTGKNARIVGFHPSQAYIKWWYEQRRRCLEGYEVGGVKITGAHYFYLNFWRIRAKSVGKGYISPLFFDLDKEFFDLVEEAKAQGKNLLLLKRRQIGFSEKLAALMAHQYIFFDSSWSIVVAGEAVYANNTMEKCLQGLEALSRDKLDAGREFYKRSSLNSNDAVVANYEFNGVWIGTMAQLEAITVNFNPQAVSGKSPTLAVMEEAGINGHLIKTYGMLLPAMEERGRQMGRLVIFVGTGGEMKAGADQLMRLFYAPHKYNLLATKNIWDKGLESTECCHFFPAWKYYVMDQDGNSYQEAGEILIAEKRATLDLQSLAAEKTQMPLCPREAFTITDETFFNVEKLERQRTFLLANEWKDKEQWGRLDWVFDKEDSKKIVGVKWTPADSKSLDGEGDENYPILITEHPVGCAHTFVRMFDSPVEKNLYFAGTDSYDKDKAQTSDSEGSCSIFKGYHRAGATSMLFAARLTWRPMRKEKFFEMTARMCMYYHGCKNLIEWSNLTIFDWYKNNKFTSLLKERPLISHASAIRSQVDNKFGVDPNTKHVWLDRMSSYIEEYYTNIYDFSLVDKLSRFRIKNYNCDATIGASLAHENYKDTEIILKENAQRESTPQSWVTGFVRNLNGGYRIV